MTHIQNLMSLTVCFQTQHERCGVTGQAAPASSRNCPAGAAGRSTCTRKLGPTCLWPHGPAHHEWTLWIPPHCAQRHPDWPPQNVWSHFPQTIWTSWATLVGRSCYAAAWVHYAIASWSSTAISRSAVVRAATDPNECSHIPTARVNQWEPLPRLLPGWHAQLCISVASYPGRYPRRRVSRH